MWHITIIVALALLVPDAYIYLLHVRPATGRWGYRLLYWLPSLVLLGIYGYFIALSGDNTLAHHTVGIGRLAIAIILFATSKLAFVLCSLVGLLVHGVVGRVPRTPFNVVGSLLAGIIFGCTLWGTLVGVSNFEVREVEYTSPRLPDAFEGYRVLQLSDLHLGSWVGSERKIEKLVKLVNEQKADLILFTGDLVNQRSSEAEGFASILSRLSAPDGVYSVLGNHDYGDYYQWPSPEKKVQNLARLNELQAEMGWTLLNNEHVILRHGGDSIALCGVENDGEPPFSRHADLKRAIAGSDSLFTLLMSHNPTHWRREVLPESRTDLMLAGHTHAMQSVLFGRSLAELKYPEWKGFYHEEGRSLYVNVGIGYVGLPFRFGANPEITVIRMGKLK